MPDAVFEILCSAVNLARFEQIRCVAALKSRLLREYPGREDEVEQAIRSWANYEQEKGRAAPGIITDEYHLAAGAENNAALARQWARP